jgi:hypothetical protein
MTRRRQIGAEVEFKCLFLRGSKIDDAGVVPRDHGGAEGRGMTAPLRSVP